MVFTRAPCGAARSAGMDQTLLNKIQQLALDAPRCKFALLPKKPLPVNKECRRAYNVIRAGFDEWPGVEDHPGITLSMRSGATHAFHLFRRRGVPLTDLETAAQLQASLDAGEKAMAPLPQQVEPPLTLVPTRGLKRAAPARAWSLASVTANPANRLRYLIEVMKRMGYDYWTTCDELKATARSSMQGALLPQSMANDDVTHFCRFWEQRTEGFDTIVDAGCAGLGITVWARARGGGARIITSPVSRPSICRVIPGMRSIHPHTWQ